MTWRSYWKVEGDGGGVSGKKAAEQFETCVSRFMRPLDIFSETSGLFRREETSPASRGAATSQHNTDIWISRNKVKYQHFVHAVCRERKEARAEERVKSQDKQGNSNKRKEKEEEDKKKWVELTR